MFNRMLAKILKNFENYHFGAVKKCANLEDLKKCCKIILKILENKYVLAKSVSTQSRTRPPKTHCIILVFYIGGFPDFGIHISCMRVLLAGKARVTSGHRKTIATRWTKEMCRSRNSESTVSRLRRLVAVSGSFDCTSCRSSPSRDWHINPISETNWATSPKEKSVAFATVVYR